MDKRTPESISENSIGKDSNKKDRLLKDYIATVTILEHLPEAIFLVDTSGNIEYANRSALNILQAEFNGVVGRKLYQFMMPELPNLMTQICQERLNEFETALINQNQTIPVWMSVGVVKNYLENIDYIIVSARDLTIRKQLQHETKEKEELAILEIKIKALQKLAIALVHELSQPLASLKLNTELTQRILKTSPENTQLIDNHLGQTSKMLDSMSETIEKVRNFAMQRPEDSFKLVDLKECIENALKHIAYEIQERKLRICLFAENNLPFITGSPSGVEQIFITLVKYMESAFKKDTSTDKRINIHIINVENKWVEVKLENFTSVEQNLSGKAETLFDDMIRKLGPGMKMEMYSVRAAILELGGDIELCTKKEGGVSVMLRIPVDEGEERTQLVNMIELLHRQ